MPYQEDYEIHIGTKGPLFRAVPSADDWGLVDKDFESNAALGKSRLHDEDATDFYSVSCFDSFEQARDNAIRFDPRGRRWYGIAEFSNDGDQGHTFAYTYEPGHWSVWGEPGALRARVVRVLAFR